MKVLIIEDDERIAHVTEKGLKEEGFTVDIAHNGEDGEFMAEENPYDCIVLDLNLPDRDGLQICKKLRQKKINTPVIMVTARTSTDDRVLGLNTGADDYLPKPCATTLGHLIAQEGILAEHTIVIDDMAENLVAAQSIGAGTCLISENGAAPFTWDFQAPSLPDLIRL